jgi:hypothetical protein
VWREAPDLVVQTPIKHETLLNLNATKALGLTY